MNGEPIFNEGSVQSLVAPSSFYWSPYKNPISLTRRICQDGFRDLSIGFLLLNFEQFVALNIHHSIPLKMKSWYLQRAKESYVIFNNLSILAPRSGGSENLHILLFAV